MRLEGVHVAFAGADADGLLEGADEDFAVADLTRAGRGGDRLDRALDELARHRDFDLQLRAESSRRIRRRDRFPCGLFAGRSL